MKEDLSLRRDFLKIAHRNLKRNQEWTGSALPVRLKIHRGTYSFEVFSRKLLYHREKLSLDFLPALAQHSRGRWLTESVLEFDYPFFNYGTSKL